MKIRVLLGMMLVGMLMGCSFGPDYCPSMVTVPTHYKEAPEGWKIAKPCDECDRGPWWAVFNDPILNDLEEQVNISNQNIMATYAQYMQARALVSQARAAYFPTLSGMAVVTPQKSAAAGSQSVDNINVTPRTGTFINYDMELDATWAPDLWGTVRRAVEGSIAGAQADKAQVAAVRLLAQASLAQYYFELRGLDNDQIILNNNVNNYQKLLEITLNQYKAGTVSRANVLQAESLLELAKVQAMDNGILRAQYEHAIAMLAGTVPADVSIAPCAYELHLPDIPVQIPSDLLERRPDIAQAERAVAQASAQIGVAIAAYFPVLNITAADGYNADNVGHLFSPLAQFWSIANQLTQILFDGGLRNAQLDVAWATVHQMVAQYRQTVLAAFQDVEDNLVALRILSQELTTQEQAVKISEESLSVTLNEYKAGTLALADVLNAELTLFTAQKGANDIAYRRATSAVNLIRALGGGWNVSLLK